MPSLAGVETRRLGRGADSTRRPRTSFPIQPDLRVVVGLLAYALPPDQPNPWSEPCSSGVVRSSKPGEARCESSSGSRGSLCAAAPAPRQRVARGSDDPSRPRPNASMRPQRPGMSSSSSSPMEAGARDRRSGGRRSARAQHGAQQQERRPGRPRLRAACGGVLDGVLGRRRGCSRRTPRAAGHRRARRHRVCRPRSWPPRRLNP